MQNRILCFSSRRLPLHHRRFLSHFIPDNLYDPPFSPSSKPHNKSKEKKKKKNNNNSEAGNGAPKFPLESNLPFDFRYSYSETDPSVGPISFRESPKFSPFGPGRLDRKWTGVSAPVRGEPDRKRFEEERNRVRGEPLSEEEVAELVERYRHSDCARQINLGKGGVTHNMLDDIHNHWKKAEAVRIKCLGVPTLDMENVCFHLEDKSGGKVIYRNINILLLYRGRNYDPKNRPVIPLMLWMPYAPIYPRLVKNVIEGLAYEETKEMRNNGLNSDPLMKLTRNGVYVNVASSMHTTNAFPRRRHPTISLRGSSQEEAQEIRLKANNKMEREWTKKRRGSNSHSTEEESVGGNEQDAARMYSNNTASSASDQNHHHRGRTWNVTDELIGATVPRRTRSASVKRPHQSAEAASPSSSNVSLPKKMKSIPSSSNEEDIEIEIAELLYGLRASQNHESSSSLKLEESDSAEKKRVEDFSSSLTQPPNNSTAESVRIETEQPAKAEKPSPESPRMSGGHGIGSSQCPKQVIVEDNLKAGARCGNTARGACDDVPGVIDQHKFEIDLMAPPPVNLSPERGNLSRGKDGIKVENFVKKEKILGEIEEVKTKVDLEKPIKHSDTATNHELGEQDRNKEQPTTFSTNQRLEKTVQCSSMSLSTALSERPASVSPPGCMPPLGTIVKTVKTTGLSTAPQHGNFVLSHPRPKRCTTHDYIARCIFMHQQRTKMNTLLPSAIGCGSICDTKPHNVNRMHSAESVVVGKESHNQLPGVSQNAAVEKGWAATSDFSLAAIKSSGPANSMDLTQMKQLVLQQGPHPGSSANIVHGPAFLFPPGQHQASVTTGTSQAGGVNSASSTSLSNKFHYSAAGSLGTSTLPAVAAAMSFSYPNLAANDAPPYMTVVPNGGYPFPFSTPLVASAAIRGVSHAQSTPMLNGPFYSSQFFHPLQYPQQHPHSQALVQPSYLNASTSTVSSSSHKQSQGMQGNSSNILSSTAMQLQQSQKQHSSQSHPHKHESGMAGENATSAASGTAYSQKNIFGQNFTIPVQPLSLSFMPSATSDIVSGNSGNFGDKRQQQQSLKGGLEHIQSQPYAISFAAYNGTSVPSNLNFSSMAQNPVIFQSLPDIAWQGYHAGSTSQATQQKMYPIMEGKSGGNSSHQDDEKKATSGKPSSNGPTTLVFDNSSKNLNFVSSPMNGNWPSRSITSTATTTSLPLSSNAANSQQPPQLLHLQQQHGMLQQQPAVATRYKALSTNATTAAKFLNAPPDYSQTQTQCKSSNQGSQSKNLVRTIDSQVPNPSIITSTTPILQSYSQDQGRVMQGHTQISFGRNYLSSLPHQGQQLFNNSQSLSTTVAAGTPPSGGSNLKTNSQGSKVSSSVNNTSQMQQTENSSTGGTGQKSSPVCGRNVPSILSSCPSHLSELKY